MRFMIPAEAILKYECIAFACNLFVGKVPDAFNLIYNCPNSGEGVKGF